jgi:hypothetical protein
MTNDIKSKVAATAKSAAPWKKGIAWWIVLLEGLVLTGLGLYMLFAKPSTLVGLGWVLALSLVASGALSVYLSLKTTAKTPARQYTLIHGVVGLAAGALVILLQLLGSLSGQTAAVVLGLGALIYGGMGLYPLIDKNLVPLRRISLIGAIFFVVVGVLLTLQALGMGTFVTTVQILNLLIMAAGIALIFYGFILRNNPAA